MHPHTGYPHRQKGRQLGPPRLSPSRLSEIVAILFGMLQIRRWEGWRAMRECTAFSSPFPFHRPPPSVLPSVLPPRATCWSALLRPHRKGKSHAIPVAARGGQTEQGTAVVPIPHHIPSPRFAMRQAGGRTLGIGMDNRRGPTRSDKHHRMYPRRLQMVPSMCVAGCACCPTFVR